MSAPGGADAAAYCARQERKLFDERFIRLDTRRLCELTSAADALGMKSLVDLTSRALARMIEGKTPEEIRETFHLPDDLTGAAARSCQAEVVQTRSSALTHMLVLVYMLGRGGEA